MADVTRPRYLAESAIAEGAPAVRAAYAMGQAMTTDEAITFALGEE